MAQVSLEDFLSFVRLQEGKDLYTIARKAKFSVKVKDGGVEYLPFSTMEPRHDELGRIEGVLERFAETGSYNPGDYRDIAFCASYTLTLIRQYIEERGQPPYVEGAGARSTSGPRLDRAPSQRRYPKEEFARRGNEIYSREIRPLVENEENKGKFVLIDIETGTWEMDADERAAARKLDARLPAPQVWTVRIGYPYVRRFGAGRTSGVA